jgi:CRP-like cAMP-binding protein
MDAVVTTLRTVSLFAELPREVLARLVSEFEELEVPAGRTVFSQGDPGDALYVIGTGAVERPAMSSSCPSRAPTT